MAPPSSEAGIQADLPNDLHTHHLRSSSIISPTARPSASYLSRLEGGRATGAAGSPLSSTPPSRADSRLGGEDVPPALISPAFTPPSTPGTPHLRARPGIVNDSSKSKPPPNLLKTLPEVNCLVRARIPTTTGTEIFLHLYQNNIDDKEHLAIVFGSQIRSSSLDAAREGESEMDRMIRGAYTGRLYPGRVSSTSETSTSANAVFNSSTTAMITTTASSQSSSPQYPLVRIHSECYTGETAWSARCDCGEQLDEAARLMALENNGVVVYLRQEGRGIGLGEKLKAYNLQDLGNDTVEANLILRHPADARTYGLATAILLDLGQTDIRLLTNNPEKIAAVEGPNKEIDVKERVPMIPLAWKGLKGGVTGKEVGEYLKTKISRMGHLLAESMP